MMRRSNRELLEAVETLVRQVRGVTRELLVELGEVDARRLYLNEACSSMFAFCSQRLGFSEDVAYKRIQAARLGRRFPAVLEAFGAGQIHLAGLAVLAPHLTPTNHAELLTAAAGLTKRQIEALVADRFPAAAPARRKGTLRRLRAPLARGRKTAGRGREVEGGGGVGVVQHSRPRGERLSCSLTPKVVPRSSPPDPQSAPEGQSAPEPQSATRARSAELAPGQAEASGSADGDRSLWRPAATTRSGSGLAAPSLAPTPSAALPADVPGRTPEQAEALYRLSLTVGPEFAEKLEEAKALLSHSVPDGDLARIVELGLDALLERARRQRRATRKGDRGSIAATGEARAPAVRAREAVSQGGTELDGELAAAKKPEDPVPADRPSGRSRGSGAAAPPQERSRYIPAEVRRRVWSRDEGRCAFVDARGRRCGSRWYLQINHIQPYALGGSNEVSNLRLLCSAHNQQRAREGRSSLTALARPRTGPD